MAVKHICDRCGRVINPETSATFCEFTRTKHALEEGDIYELCTSCTMLVKKYLNEDVAMLENN